jgi:ribulose-phosphate 3-epimerase
MIFKKESCHLVAPSILSADFSSLGKEVRDVESAGADRLHIDVMDGHFVPNLTIGAPVVKSLKKVSTLPLDVHLMVNKPENIVSSFISAGADAITIHLESTDDPEKVLKQIRQEKVSAGLTLKPSTPVERIFPFLSFLDLVLIMTVEPGFGGQSLLPDQVLKISAVKEELARQGLNNLPVHVDGGVNLQTLPLLSSADVLVAGHFIFTHKSYREAISLLKNNAISP